MSPRWGLLLGETSFLHTCRPAGACSLEVIHFYTYITPLGKPRLFAHLPFFSKLGVYGKIKEKQKFS